MSSATPGRVRPAAPAVRRATWMKRPRQRVPTPGVNQKHALFGALDWASGAWHFRAEPRKIAVSFVGFLNDLLLAYPSGGLILVMDNVVTHRAKAVRRWLAEHTRARILWLPRYAGHEANPAERIWGLMKNAIAANRLARNVGELVAAATRFVTSMLPHPSHELQLAQTTANL